jgi:hypothetical protein
MTNTDCRSDDGITVGLIDSIITACRVLRKRDFAPLPVQEALKDLAADGDFARLKEATCHAVAQPQHQGDGR